MDATDRPLLCLQLHHRPRILNAIVDYKRLVRVLIVSPRMGLGYFLERFLVSYKSDVTTQFIIFDVNESLYVRM